MENFAFAGSTMRDAELGRLARDRGIVLTDRRVGGMLYWGKHRLRGAGLDAVGGNVIDRSLAHAPAPWPGARRVSWLRF